MICSEKRLPHLHGHHDEFKGLDKGASFLKTPAEAKEDTLTVEKFTQRVAKIRGRARTMDLIELQHCVGQIQDKLLGRNELAKLIGDVLEKKMVQSLPARKLDSRAV